MESFDANPKIFAKDLQYLFGKLQRAEISRDVAAMVGFNQVPKAQALIEKVSEQWAMISIILPI